MSVQNARAFNMNARDVSHVGRDQHIHYHSHRTSDSPELAIRVDTLEGGPLRSIPYQLPPVPCACDPSLQSSLRYALLLLQEKQGYPLWSPQPNPTLPEEYVCEGIRIGDVGIVHHDKSFDFLFNITYPAHHPINHRGVPDGFTQVRLEDLDIIEDSEFRNSDSYVVGPRHVLSRSRVLDENSGEGFDRPYRFTASNHQGAVLVLPEGSSRATLESKAIFLNYAKAHANEWFSYAEHRRGRVFPDGTDPSLYLVTGWEKCSAWGISSYFVPPFSQETVNLTFNAHKGESRTYSWSHNGRCDTRSHPSTRWPLTAEPRTNQSVFVRGFKISRFRGLPKWLWRGFKVQDVTEITAKEVLDLPADTSASCSSSSSTNFMPSYSYKNENTSGSTRQQIRSGDITDEIIIDDSSALEQVSFHPCDAVNDFMHNIASQSTGSLISFAISHDDDWISSIGNDEETSLLEPNSAIELITYEFLKNLCHKFTIVVDKNIVHTEPMSQPTYPNPLNDIIARVKVKGDGEHELQEPAGEAFEPTWVRGAGNLPWCTCRILE
ncbi:hypothetical protein Moror_4324 [Moniliophthora roreri MCA 2997]|uniref:Uncharacterized protein n=2 Tax=Moniliophthora roreri TaxID=221103 RepID=V2X0L0_MONRO|nr:hypothetical protein Moror_4324 [Moniliophthora roreri MCA 2997]